MDNGTVNFAESIAEVLDWQVAKTGKSSICSLAARPEVEGFRDQGFALPEVESLRFQSLWFLK